MRAHETTSLSVIIPVRNGEVMIGMCLESLASQSRAPDEIIVVDNGSTDQTVLRVKEWAVTHTKITLSLVMEKKLGPSAARNRGVKAAKGKIVAFLDSDCIAPTDWLQRIAEEIHNGADAVGGPYQTHSSASAIEKYAAMSWFVSGENQAFHFHHPFISRFLLGGNMALLRRHLEEVGGFDETLRAGEDLDLSFRLAKNGLSLKYVPQLAVIHQIQSHFSKRVRRAFSHGTLQSKIAQRDFYRRLTFSVSGRSWQWRFPVTIAIEGNSLTKIFGVGILVGITDPRWGSLFFLALIVAWEARMGYRLSRVGTPLRWHAFVSIPWGWATSRLAMESGRWIGSVRYRVFCW